MLSIVLNTPGMVDFNLALDCCHCSHFTDELMLTGLILGIFRVLEIPLTPIILTIPFTDVYSDSIKVKWALRYDGRLAIRAYNLEYKKEKDLWRQYRYGIPPPWITFHLISMNWKSSAWNQARGINSVSERLMMLDQAFGVNILKCEEQKLEVG